MDRLEFMEAMEQQQRNMAMAFRQANHVSTLEPFTGKQDLQVWLDRLEGHFERLGINTAREKASGLREHCKGEALEELLCSPHERRHDYDYQIVILKGRFGRSLGTVAALQAAFFSRYQEEGEDLAAFTLSLMRMHTRAENAAVTREEKDHLTGQRNRNLSEQMVRGARDPIIRQDLRRLVMAHDGQDFHDIRLQVLRLYPTGDRERGLSGRSAAARGVEVSYSNFPGQETMPVKKVEEMFKKLQDSISLQKEVAVARVETHPAHYEYEPRRVQNPDWSPYNSAEAPGPTGRGRPQQTQAPAMGRGSNQGTIPADKKCYTCGLPGHFFRNCPNAANSDRQRGGNGYNRNDNRSQGGSKRSNGEDWKEPVLLLQTQMQQQFQQMQEMTRLLQNMSSNLTRPSQSSSARPPSEQPRPVNPSSQTTNLNPFSPSFLGNGPLHRK